MLLNFESYSSKLIATNFISNLCSHSFCVDQNYHWWNYYYLFQGVMLGSFSHTMYGISGMCQAPGREMDEPKPRPQKGAHKTGNRL